jgi:hypothetical protein
MERARNLVALDRALGQVAAHVSAVAVQHLQVTARIGEHHELGTESLDRVRFTVEEFLDRSQAVPASREPVRQGAGVDFANAAASGIRTHFVPPVGGRL